MRIILVLLLPLLLSSCYRPVYGKRPFGADATAQEKRLNTILIGNIQDESGQTLRNFLIDRMYGAGRPDKTDAILDIGLSSYDEDLGLQKDATTLRKKVTYRANYTLSDSKTHQIMFRRSSRTFVSYDKIDAQYGALVSKEAAQDRALRELADLIVTQLLVYYGQADYSPTPMTEYEANMVLKPEEKKPTALDKPEAIGGSKDVFSK
jgi:hypothetical protein